MKMGRTRSARPILWTCRRWDLKQSQQDRFCEQYAIISPAPKPLLNSPRNERDRILEHHAMRVLAQFW